MYHVFKLLLRLPTLHTSTMYFRVHDKWSHFLKTIQSSTLNFLVYILHFCISGVIMVLVKDHILHFVTQQIGKCYSADFPLIIFIIVLHVLALQMLSSVPAYDAVIERLPYMEQELSRLLCHIKIRRRERHHIVMAEEYEVLLNKILNTMRRNQDLVRRMFRSGDLSRLEMVVEG